MLVKMSKELLKDAIVVGCIDSRQEQRRGHLVVRRPLLLRHVHTAIIAERASPKARQLSELLLIGRIHDTLIGDNMTSLIIKRGERLIWVANIELRLEWVPKAAEGPLPQSSVLVAVFVR